MLLVYLFWVSFLLIVYVYFGYPLLLFFQSKLFPQPIAKTDSKQKLSVSVVIAVKNESNNIKRRIQNILDQDYPSDKLEIVIVSDGSDDDTYSIVQQVVNADNKNSRSTIINHQYFPSHGKPTALNRGVTLASGEIIVFADARQYFEDGAIHELVNNFSDLSVGVVSGELIFLKDGKSTIQSQMGAYWKYEKKIRNMESKTGSVVGATGAIYAIRRDLYQPLPSSTLLDDVMTPLNIALEGYRIVFDSSAVAYDVVSKDTKQEWYRKVRTLTGNWQLLSLKPSLINVFQNPLWFRFLSHKLGRVVVPFFLVILFLTSVQQGGTFYTFATAAQIVFYFLAALGHCVPIMRKNSLVQLCYFFCVLNCAALKGFVIWVTGGCENVWVADSSCNKKE